MKDYLQDLRYIKSRLEKANITYKTKPLDNIEKCLKEYELMKQTKIIVADKNISEDDIEKLKNQRMFVGNLEYEIKPLFDKTIEKKLKALEIIIEKRVNVWAIVMTKNVDEYNFSIVNEIAKKLTQEEYKLLKGIMK